MDLKSGCLFWPDVDGKIATYGPLEADCACDVAIIGGGITGALLGYVLSGAGVNVVIVDRREIGHGSTAASTGLLQYEIDTPLHELTDLIGVQSAQHAYRLCLEALKGLRDIVTTLGQGVAMTPKQSLYLASDEDDVADLRSEYAARKAAGIDVDFLEQGDIEARFSFSRPAGLWSPMAMEVDPYQLAHALIRAIKLRGARVFGRTQVEKYLPDESGVTLVTTAGPRIRAKKIVFATGYETPEFLDQNICTLKVTYALTSEPLTRFDGWYEKCLIWETSRPYFYARTTTDGRAMIGGEDEPHLPPEKRDALIPKKTAMLAAKFRRFFPGIDFVPSRAWAGVFAETKDGLPYIGTTPQFPHGYFALGYGGNGITFSLIAARIIRDHFLGKANEDAKIFRFDR